MRPYLDHAFLDWPNAPTHTADAETVPGYDFAGVHTGLQLGQLQRRPNQDLLVQLERAESLTAAGAYPQALAIYAGCTRDQGAERAYADLCRYETARIYGFAQGAPARARPIFERLARTGEGEVRRQAMLALCELDRETSPCNAVDCLGRVTKNPDADQALRHEALRLSERWARNLDCATLPAEDRH